MAHFLWNVCRWDFATENHIFWIGPASYMTSDSKPNDNITNETVYLSYYRCSPSRRKVNTDNLIPVPAKYWLVFLRGWGIISFDWRSGKWCGLSYVFMVSGCVLVRLLEMFHVTVAVIAVHSFWSSLGFVVSFLNSWTDVKFTFWSVFRL